jgi:hypothetical protein
MSQQELEYVGVPIPEDIPVVGDGPMLGDSPRHGVVLNVEPSGDGTEVTGLRPPAPSSVEPIGIPTRPRAAAEPIPVGDEADPAGPAKELPPVCGQPPDAVPAMPPPSNAVVDVEVPAVEMPVPNDVPVMEPSIPVMELMELPVPVMEVPVPDDIPVPEIACPNEDSGIEPPKPRHPGLVTVVGTSGYAPDVNGLTPGDPIAVAPSGMPTGGTGEAGPMPSGDVVPIGAGADDICAKAGRLQTQSATRNTAVTARRILSSRIAISQCCLPMLRGHFDVPRSKARISP